MRTTVGVLMGICVLFVGIFAVSESGQSAEGVAMNSSAGASAYNMSSGVFDGVGQAAAPGIVWMGVAAIVLVSLGFLVTAGRSGGRR